MDPVWVGATTALWLGILTSISPCPLATNITAVSYLGRRIGSTRYVLSAGLLYTLGRTAAYQLLAALLVGSALSASIVSNALQKYMHLALGPILIVVAMLLLGLIRLGGGGPTMSESMQKRVDELGIAGAFVLGALFAVSFCPLSASLFFLGLIPLAIEAESSFLLPGLYGIGTALPALAFAVAIALGAQAIGKAYNWVAGVEQWARRATGAVFLVVGIYFCLKYVFEVV